jgi:hypothetical protein
VVVCITLSTWQAHVTQYSHLVLSTCIQPLCLGGHLCGYQPGFCPDSLHKSAGNQANIRYQAPQAKTGWFPAPRTENQLSLGDSRPDKLGILSVGWVGNELAGATAACKPPCSCSPVHCLAHDGLQALNCRRCITCLPYCVFSLVLTHDAVLVQLRLGSTGYDTVTIPTCSNKHSTTVDQSLWYYGSPHVTGTCHSVTLYMRTPLQHADQG